MTKKRKSRSDSIESAVAAKKHKHPESPTALKDAELEVWRQMVGVRTDWRDFDLILLVKVVRLEVKLQDWWDMLEQSGPMIRNKRQTLIENPILRSITTFQNQQLSIITKMRVMEGLGDARTSNVKPAETRQEHTDNVVSLLATPKRQ